MRINSINNFAATPNFAGSVKTLPAILKDKCRSEMQKSCSYPYITLNGTINILKNIIENFGTVIENEVYRGACPTLEGLKALAKKGIKVIIDLRHDAPASYKKQVLSLGMQYINLPSYIPEYISHTLKNHEEIVKAINSTNGPVFIHCDGGCIRTGVQAALCQILKNGVREQTAFENAKEHDSTGYVVIQLEGILNEIHNGCLFA